MFCLLFCFGLKTFVFLFTGTIKKWWNLQIQKIQDSSLEFGSFVFVRLLQLPSSLQFSFSPATELFSSVFWSLFVHQIFRFNSGIWKLHFGIWIWISEIVVLFFVKIGIRTVVCVSLLSQKLSTEFWHLKFQFGFWKLDLAIKKRLFWQVLDIRFFAAEISDPSCFPKLWQVEVQIWNLKFEIWSKKWICPGKPQLKVPFWSLKKEWKNWKRDTWVNLRKKVKLHSPQQVQQRKKLLKFLILNFSGKSQVLPQSCLYYNQFALTGATLINFMRSTRDGCDSVVFVQNPRKSK